MIEEPEFDPDPLNFNLKWVNGACYRNFERKTGSIDPNFSEKPNFKPYYEFDDEEEFQENENCGDFEVRQIESGRFQTTIPIPPCFFAYIIGTKGSRKKQLENSTKSEIRIPRGKNEKNILITGPTAANVVSARQKIDLISQELREKHPITHFVSFPLISKEIKSNFEHFKKEILNDQNLPIDESIFISGDKLHLTVGTLTLLDDEEIERAVKIFEKMKGEVVDPFFRGLGALKIRVKGLQYMNDDPSSVDVLYAKIEAENSKSGSGGPLGVLSESIVEFFQKNGLMKKNFDRVKLHATLMNTRYQRDKNDPKSSRKSFDARPILEKWGTFDFGVQNFEEIHLSDRSVVDKNGYYGSVATIKINSE